MVALLASPTVFVGQQVRITGWLALYYEGWGLYLSKEDMDQWNPKNGIALSNGLVAERACLRLGGRFVEATGQVVSGQGHMDNWSAEMVVSELRAWHAVDGEPARCAVDTTPPTYPGERDSRDGPDGGLGRVGGL